MASKTGNPFLDQNFQDFFDVRKYTEQFQMPGMNSQALMDMQRKNMEAVAQANRIAFEGAQAIAQRQQDIVRQAMDEAVKAMKEMQDAGSNEERVKHQTEIAKKAFETAQKNVRELTEMSSKSNSEAIELINKRVAESFDEMRQSLSEMAKQADTATKQATQAATVSPSSGKSGGGSGASGTSKAAANKS
jgi:phasin family protein